MALLAVSDRVAHPLTQAEREYREVAAAQMPDCAAHQRREPRCDQPAANHHDRPRQRGDAPRGDISAEPEEGRGRKRQIVSRTGKHRPRDRQAGIHEAGQGEREQEVRKHPGHRAERDAGADCEAENPALTHRVKSPFGRRRSTAMKTTYESSILSDGLVKCVPNVSTRPSNRPPNRLPAALPSPPSVMTMRAVTV